MVRDRFLAHQRTDKGFGPALGPDAASISPSGSRRAGHKVTIESSDWQLGPADRALLEAMLEGVIAAAARSGRTGAWWTGPQQRRLQLARGELGLTVGHVDLLALPETA